MLRHKSGETEMIQNQPSYPTRIAAKSAILNIKGAIVNSVNSGVSGPNVTKILQKFYTMSSNSFY